MREPEYNQDLLVKLFSALSSPGCSVFTAVSLGEEDPSVRNIRDAQSWMPRAGLQNLILRVTYKL